MRPQVLGVVAIAWSALVGVPALGQEPDDVDRIESLAARADFDQAELAATRALSNGALRPEAAARIYVVLGTIAAARGSMEDAEALFRKALILDPRAVLPSSAGPHVRAPFSRARAVLAEVELARAQTVPPRLEAPVTTEVPTRPVPTSVWVAGTATGAFAVATLVLGVTALDRRATFEQANVDPRQTVMGRSALRDSALILEHATTIAGVAAFASAALTTLFYVSRPTLSDRLAVTIVPETRGGGVLLSAKF